MAPSPCPLSPPPCCPSPCYTMLRHTHIFIYASLCHTNICSTLLSTDMALWARSMCPMCPSLSHRSNSKWRHNGATTTHLNIPLLCHPIPTTSLSLPHDIPLPPTRHHPPFHTTSPSFPHDITLPPTRHHPASHTTSRCLPHDSVLPHHAPPLRPRVSCRSVTYPATSNPDTSDPDASDSDPSLQ